MTRTKRKRAAKWRKIAEQYDRDPAYGLCFAAYDCGVFASRDDETPMADDLQRGLFKPEPYEKRDWLWWGAAEDLSPKARERCINARVIAALLIALTLED